MAEAQFFGKLDRLIDIVAGADGRQTSQHFHIEQRNAANRADPRDFQWIAVGRFRKRIEQNRLYAEFVFVLPADSLEANAVTDVN